MYFQFYLFCSTVPGTLSIWIKKVFSKGKCFLNIIYFYMDNCPLKMQISEK